MRPIYIYLIILFCLLCALWLAGLWFVHHRNRLERFIEVNPAKSVYLGLQEFTYATDPVFGETPTIFPELYGFTFDYPRSYIDFDPEIEKELKADPEYNKIIESHGWMYIHLHEDHDYVLFESYKDNMPHYDTVNIRSNVITKKQLLPYFKK